MLVKGVESWMRGGEGDRRGKNRKRESCNLYIKASIERVSAILPKREEEIQTGESMYIRHVGVRRYMQQLARSV